MLRETLPQYAIRTNLTCLHDTQSIPESNSDPKKDEKDSNISPQHVQEDDFMFSKKVLSEVSYCSDDFSQLSESLSYQEQDLQEENEDSVSSLCLDQVEDLDHRYKKDLDHKTSEIKSESENNIDSASNNQLNQLKKKEKTNKIGELLPNYGLEFIIMKEVEEKQIKEQKDLIKTTLIPKKENQQENFDFNEKLSFSDTIKVIALSSLSMSQLQSLKQ